MSIWLVLYIAAVVANGIILHNAGFDTSTLTHWGSGICVLAAYIAGREHERNL